MKRNVLFGIGTALTVASLLTVGQQNASAVVVPVSAVLDPTVSINFETDVATIFGWNVGGTNHLFQTTYQYDLGGGFNAVGQGGLNYVNHTLSTFGADRILTVNYDHPDFTYQLRMTLSGGFGASSLLVRENIVGKPNIAPGGLTMALREYADMDLAGTFPGDTLVGNNSSATQTDTGVQFVQNFVGASGVLINPQFTDTTGIFTSPIDASFTYTWNFTLVASALTQGASDPNSQGTVTIQKQISTFETGVIPEPVTATLSLAGLMVLGGALLRRSR